jgi:hypothetical protein
MSAEKKKIVLSLEDKKRLQISSYPFCDECQVELYFCVCSCGCSVDVCRTCFTKHMDEVFTEWNYPSAMNVYPDVVSESDSEDDLSPKISCSQNNKIISK